MDCIHARLVMVFHNGEGQALDADARAALDQHLEVCADCLAWSHQENRVDDAIGAAIRSVAVPADLPSKILHQLEQRRPRRGPSLSAAAAALLLAASVGGYLWFTHKPEVTMTDFEVAVVHHESRTAYDVEQDFADQGMPIKLPEDFRFEFYKKHMIDDVRGRKVPRIDFFNPNDPGAAVAYVYVIATDRFQAEDIIAAIKTPTATAIVTSKHRIEARDFGYPGYVYVIVYTGSGLQPFFISRPTA